MLFHINLKAWIMIMILFNNILFISNDDYEEDEEEYEEEESENGDGNDDTNNVSTKMMMMMPQVEFNHDNCYNKTSMLKFDNYACINQSKCCNLIAFIFEGGRFNKENFLFSLYSPRLINILFLIMIPFISASLLIGCFLGFVCSHCCKRNYTPKYSPVDSFCEQYTTTSRRPYQI